MKGMNLFNKSEQSGFEKQVKKYEKELKEAGTDYEAVKKVQDKYASVFEKSARNIVKNNPKEEEEDKQFSSNRVYLNENNKTLIMNSFKGAHGKGMKHMPNKGLCQVCGERFVGLGVYCIPDSVEVCFDCTTEENYVDFDEIIICKFGG